MAKKETATKIGSGSGKAPAPALGSSTSRKVKPVDLTKTLPIYCDGEPAARGQFDKLTKTVSVRAGRGIVLKYPATLVKDKDGTEHIEITRMTDTGTGTDYGDIA